MDDRAKPARFAPAPVYVHAVGAVAGSNSGMISLARDPAAALSADAMPVPLRASVARVAPTVSRMASRFAQLAVLGAVDCLGRLDRPLDPATPLYLATGLGDVATTDALYYGVMPPASELPPPARFATSGNNMAAFFVAQHARLSGRNLTLSDAQLSFECALDLAISDIRSGAARAALVGAVDEATLPREFYTRRFAVSSSRQIGEGSAWFLLDGCEERDGRAALGKITGVTSDAAGLHEASDSAASISRFLQAAGGGARQGAAPGIVLPGGGMSHADLTALLPGLATDPDAFAIDSYLEWSGRFPTAAALGIAAAFLRGSPQSRTPVRGLHLNRHDSGRIGIIAFEIFPATAPSP